MGDDFFKFLDVGFPSYKKPFAQSNGFSAQVFASLRWISLATCRMDLETSDLNHQNDWKKQPMIHSGHHRSSEDSYPQKNSRQSFEFLFDLLWQQKCLHWLLLMSWPWFFCNSSAWGGEKEFDDDVTFLGKETRNCLSPRSACRVFVKHQGNVTNNNVKLLVSRKVFRMQFVFRCCVWCWKRNKSTCEMPN